MKKIEGYAAFSDTTAATVAAAELYGVRHDPANQIDGGAVDVRDNVVHFSLRVRAGVAPAPLVAVVRKALKGGTAQLADADDVQYDEEQYLDKDTGEVRTHQANRVVRLLDDGTEQVLVAKARLVSAIDQESGENLGTVPVRTLLDAVTGDVVKLEGETGRPDPAVAVESV